MSPLPPFRNEPLLELRRAAARERLSGGMGAIGGRLPLRVPVWIGDDRREGDELVSTDPGDPDRVVAVAAMATEADADAAVAAAREAFPAWSRTPATRRAELLARGGAAQLEHRLVAERGQRAHGAASSSSIGRPLACSARKDSLLVFSSRRRTR